MMETFIASQAQTNKDFLNQNLHTNEQFKHTNEQIKQLTSKLDILATHNRMLETQISQVAQQQASTSAPAGIFPGQPEQNPKGHVNAIISRSGTQHDGPADPRHYTKMRE
jgi:cell shape-determining protein MreC